MDSGFSGVRKSGRGVWASAGVLGKTVLVESAMSDEEDKCHN